MGNSNTNAWLGIGFVAVLVTGGVVYSNLNNQLLSSTGAVFTTIAAPLIGSKLAHSVLDFVPVFGWAAKSAIAAGVTKAVGEALITYFDDCSDLPD